MWIKFSTYEKERGFGFSMDDGVQVWLPFSALGQEGGQLQGFLKCGKWGKGAECSSAVGEPLLLGKDPASDSWGGGNPELECYYPEPQCYEPEGGCL